MKRICIFELKVNVEREELFSRLKKILEIVERILNDPETSPSMKLRAAEVIAVIAGKANTIIRDYEVEMLEREIEELEAKAPKPQGTP